MTTRKRRPKPRKRVHKTSTPTPNAIELFQFFEERNGTVTAVALDEDGQQVPGYGYKFQSVEAAERWAVDALQKHDPERAARMGRPPTRHTHWPFLFVVRRISRSSMPRSRSSASE